MATKKKPAKKAAKKAVKKAATKTKTAKKKPAAKPVKKAPAKKAPAKKKRTANAAFMKAMTPSEALAAVVGNKPLARTEAVKKLWVYIKANNLQDPKNRRMINADAKLKPVLGKAQVSMFELAKVLNNHLK